MPGAISRAASVIGDKITMEKELSTALSEKLAEGRIVGIAPFLMTAAMKFVSPAYMQPVYLVVGLLLILYSPVMLYINSCKQIKLNPVYKKPLHYVLDEEGVTVTSGDESLSVPWSDMYRARSTNQSILLYTGPKSAWVFPKKDLKEQRYDVIEIISTHLDPAKVKIRQ